ncbi:MAG: hypothetical protein K2X07_00690 [Caulobacteraceae bacterium]|nr:hypothetical protein [Caulobacteraceae bacterium]
MGLLRRSVFSGLGMAALSPVVAKASVTVPMLVGEVGAPNLKRLCARIADAQDQVIGMKLTVENISLPRLKAEIEEGDVYLFAEDVEVVGTDVAIWLHGSIVFDGFFIPKFGGMHQGTLSYGLAPVDEALVRLNSEVRLVEERFSL